MIEVKNLTKAFPSVLALDNISIRIKPGEFFGLLGPNGAGKSTLMNLLVGYLNPTSGEILIDGEKISRDNVVIKRKIGLSPQSLALYEDLSAQENLEIFGSLFLIEKKQLKELIKQRLHAVELYDRRKDKVKTFSGGMKRRLNLIASLLHDPPVLLCDEPTVGVDPQSRNAIFDFLTELNRNGKTIIYTTHYMEEAERLCNRIAIIDAGNIIAEGTLEELLKKMKIEQTIVINKNPQSIQHLDLFRKYGRIIDEQEYFELQPAEDFCFSRFYKMVEENGIGYQLISIKKPSLEALFLHLTGRMLRD